MGFGDLGKKLSKLGQDTKNGVQKVSDSVSISNRISAEKKSLERLFASIGEAVYKEAPDTPRAGLEDEWAAVKVAYANIASLEDQLNHVKGIIYCPNCGRPAAKGDKFCARCGYRLDNLQESTGSRMAKDIAEAGHEVGKIAGDAADKTGELVGGAAADARNFFTKLKDNASRFAKNAGEKMKAKVHADDADTDDFSDTPGVQEAENAADVFASEMTGENGGSEETAFDKASGETVSEAAVQEETAAEEAAQEEPASEAEEQDHDMDTADLARAESEPDGPEKVSEDTDPESSEEEPFAKWRFEEEEDCESAQDAEPAEPAQAAGTEDEW